MSTITLATLNAAYIHASLGLRCLYANMGPLQSATRLMEFTTARPPDAIVEALLTPDGKSAAPASGAGAAAIPGIANREPAQPCRIIGFGVYIWNVQETTEVIRLLKILRPEIRIIVGGPEVSFEQEQQPICRLADYVITGQADLAFAGLCDDLLNDRAPTSRLVSPLPIRLQQLQSPYAYYTAEDLAHRVLYVEASRGCPFKCEFCLSSLDRTAEAFDLDRFLADMQALLERGARQFKFVDRTFNLKTDTSRRILAFFLAHIELRQQAVALPPADARQQPGSASPESPATHTTEPPLFLHFELVPDRLPEPLCELLQQFPPGSLQLEIGIQSFNPAVQQRISRRQNHQRTCDNLHWLREHTHAHLHTDLIFGLPGETLESFGEGFDLLYSLDPQEIQVGLLKRLRGTPITRHTAGFGMRYASSPPYRLLANQDVEFATVQRMQRFSRYWDLLANSGRFPASLPLFLGDEPFRRFLLASDWLYATTGQTHRIALERLFRLLCRLLHTMPGVEAGQVESALLADYRHNGLRGTPDFSAHPARSVVDGPALAVEPVASGAGNARQPASRSIRQQRHAAG